MWHAFGPAAIPLEKQEKTGVAGNDPEEWKKSVLVTKNWQLYLDPSYVFGCLRNGAKYTKKGRGSVQSQLSATLQILDNRILLDRWLPDGLNSLPTDSDAPVYLDVRGVRNPSTRGMNVRYRVTASPGWKADLKIRWDVTVISKGQMEAIIIDSGKLIGLGDGRSIGFGRFDLGKFELI
jgi:hypothetical protein